MLEHFYFLENLQSEQKTDPEPVHISFAENAETLRKITTKTSDKLQERYEKEGSLTNPVIDNIRALIEPDQIENIVKGNFHLINTLIEKSQQGHPVDTLVFIDKSARNGEYLFTETCRELKKRHEIPESFDDQKIRFVNISKIDSRDEVYINSGPLKLLRDKYHRDDFVNKNVLVVDEYVSTGGTLKTAMKLIEKVFGVKPMGVQLYEYCPSWYGSSRGTLGVSELSDVIGNHDSTQEILHGLDEKSLLHLRDITTQLGQENTLHFFNQVNLIKTRMLDEDFEAKIINNKLRSLDIHNLTPGDIDFIQQLPIELKGHIIWDYFHDLGGFVSRRMPDKYMEKNFRLFRKALKDVVSESMYQRDLAKD